MPEARSDLRKALDIDLKPGRSRTSSKGPLCSLTISIGTWQAVNMKRHFHSNPATRPLMRVTLPDLNRWADFDHALAEINGDFIAPSWSIDFTTARIYDSMRNFAKAEEIAGNRWRSAIMSWATPISGSATSRKGIPTRHCRNSSSPATFQQEFRCSCDASLRLCDERSTRQGGSALETPFLGDGVWTHSRIPCCCRVFGFGDRIVAFELARQGLCRA